MPGLRKLRQRSRPLWPRRKRRIVVLSHERETETHAIQLIADFWRADGLEVVFVSGLDRFVPADVAIVHVDLSVVPGEYLDFARQYPVVLNGGVRDIRKATFSAARVTRDCDYAGSVIVKSNVNYAGCPERRLGVRTGCGADEFQTPSDYRIYRSVSHVPERFFEGEDFIVERFIPEHEDGRYHMRAFHCLGHSYTCVRGASADPIVNGSTMVGTERIEPHPELFELQRELRIDYGKLDYVVHDGAVSLLDVNKTPGAYPGPVTAAQHTARRRRADGIYAYLR
jgi:hypothetical protein